MPVKYRKYSAAGLALLLSLLISIGAKAQDSCNCLLNLQHMINKVTNNYAGYKDKVNTQTEKIYFKLIDSLSEAAKTTGSLSNCYKILDKYRVWFYDKHLQLSANIPNDEKQPDVTTEKEPVQTSWTKETFTTDLKNRKLKPLEGIWLTNGYDIGIAWNKKKGSYEGIVLRSENPNWKPGMIKFTGKKTGTNEYETNYLRGDRKEEKLVITAYKNLMEVGSFGTWKRSFPISADTISQEDFSAKYSKYAVVQFRMLNDTTLYIALKSCDLSYKAVLDRFLTDNAQKLKTIPAWIIDFRGNEGGSTDVFTNLLPYLYTKPMIGKGNKHWMTPEVTAELKKFKDENKTQLDTNSYRYISTMVDFGSQNPGSWFDDHGDTTTYPVALAYPKRVAVLSDRNNASSGETFLIDARGLSDKVTIFGERSAGFLDYGDLLPYKMPCDKLMVYIPSRRANYIDFGETYDKTGYLPDVYIPETNKDWIGFVFKYWKKK